MIIKYLPLFGVIALGFVFWKNAWVTKQDAGDDKMKRIAKWTREADIEVRAGFLVGLPGETPELAKKTIQTAIELDPDYAQFLTVCPYPGTQLAKEIKQDLSIFMDKWGQNELFIKQKGKNPGAWEKQAKDRLLHNQEQLAKSLEVDIPLVRIDFYLHKNEIYGGEVTLSADAFKGNSEESCAKLCINNTQI